MNLRQEVLKATREAAGIRARFPVGQRASFDVVGAAADLGGVRSLVSSRRPLRRNDMSAACDRDGEFDERVFQALETVQRTDWRPVLHCSRQKLLVQGAQ